MNNGKEAFIQACTEAISTLDTSNTHYLFELKSGEQVYQAKPDHFFLYNEDGSPAKLIGLFEPSFIRSYHADLPNHSDHIKTWIYKELEELLTVFNNPDYIC
ncbi:hypothetical protein [Sporolactobacillus laevolacticus]|uniref:hypothetical protein n=1 Tax=Sporolactobacillus laevolacticus TaxID=33018 RepID=UPI0025B5AB0C|nr:hypothetical protein [Sporolactobacillus laevolacticus]MDN3956803.1 hypothetical protein [Sporolactobacillus laevolacticus]